MGRDDVVSVVNLGEHNTVVVVLGASVGLDGTELEEADASSGVGIVGSGTCTVVVSFVAAAETGNGTMCDSVGAGRQI